MSKKRRQRFARSASKRVSEHAGSGEKDDRRRSESMEAGSRRRWFIHPVFWIVVLGAGLRIASIPFLFSGDNPHFNPEAFKDGDLWENLRQARAILENGGVPNDAFLHGPGYIYQVAFSLLISGKLFWFPYIVQMILGVGTAVLIYFTTARLMNRRAAAVAGVFAALYAPSIYFETIMSCDSTNTFVVALILWLGARYQDGPDRRWWPLPLAMGVALGSLTLLRPNLALMGPALAGWLLFGVVQRPLRQRIGATAVIAAMSIAMLIPASVWNSRVAGRPRFIVKESKVIWIFAWSVDSPGYFKYPDKYPEGEMLSPLDHRTWLLAAKKTGQLFAWFEFPDLTNFHLYSALAPPLRYDFIRFGLLSPLALLGAALCWRRRRRLAMLYASLLMLILTSVMFYISGRYRLALLPILFPFAAHAVVTGVDLFGKSNPVSFRGLRRLGFTGALFALGAAVNLYDPSNNLSAWHSDAIFGNHNINLARRSIQEHDLSDAKRYARRLLWLAHAGYRMRGHGILRDIANAEGDRRTAREQDAKAQYIIDKGLLNYVQDSGGRQLFPPTSGRENYPE